MNDAIKREYPWMTRGDRRRAVKLVQKRAWELRDMKRIRELKAANERTVAEMVNA